MLVRIDKIISDPNQPRKTFKEETLEELKESIDSLGLINPLTVRPMGDGKFMVIVGERRYLAARKLGLSEVECIIRDDVDDRKAREMQFAENYHLEHLPPIEQANAWWAHMQSYGMSQAEFARQVGVSDRTVNEVIDLVRKLTPKIIRKIEQEEITATEGKLVSDLLDKETQEKVADVFATGQVGGRKAPEFVKAVKQQPSRPMQEIVDEVVYGVRHIPKEELELAKAPETMLDIGFKLEEKALDLSQMLTAYDLSRIPTGQRLALTSALKILADKIELALEFLTGKKRREIEGIIEGEAKQIEN